MTDLLVVDSVTVTYPDGTEAVRDVSFHGAPGEKIAIVGESGSGKSSLGLAISGLVGRRGGSVMRGSRVTVGAHDMLASRARGDAPRGSVVGMVFQDPLAALNPVRSVKSQFSEILLRHRKASSRHDAQTIAVAALADVGIERPEQRLRAYPYQLSGGMRQRVLIAMTLSLHPDVIVADEPTSALDGQSKSHVLELLDSAATDRGACVVLISHDMLAAGGFSSRTLVMYDGYGVEYGTTDDVYLTPRHPYTSDLITSIPTMATYFRERLPTVRVDMTPKAERPDQTGCTFYGRCSHSETWRCTHEQPPKIDRRSHSAHCHFDGLLALAGAANRAWRAPATSSVHAGQREGTPLIHLRGVSKVYGLGGRFAGSRNAVRAVDDVSFSIWRDEALGIVGESGSGKSTIGRLCAFLQTPSSGTVTVDGRAVWDLRTSERRELRRNVQIVFQDPRSALDPRMRVGDAIAEPLRIHSVDAHRRRAAVDRAMDLVALERSLAQRYPHELSGGQVQRVVLARALVLGPDVLILDEPTSSLDASLKSGTLNLLHDLRSELGLSYILITHDLPAVRNLCERTLVLHDGRAVEEGPTNLVLSAPSHDYTRRLLSHESMADPPAERERRHRVRSELANEPQRIKEEVTQG